MQIGETIRRCRKSKNMTQEEMAGRLGVTAPAVNKWENGNSLPDITLLSPIARLLGISVDTLLSFRERLTPAEISEIIRRMDSMFREKPYDQVFVWAREKLEEYPDCESLIWQTAVLLDAHLVTGGIFEEAAEDSSAEEFSCEEATEGLEGAREREIPESSPENADSFVVAPFSISPDVRSPAPESPASAEKYEAYICSLFERVLESGDEMLRGSAADSLYGFYMRKKCYDKAEEYLRYFSIQNPERKRKQAEILLATGRTQEGLKTLEELLFDQYRTVNAVLHEMYLAALKGQDMERARLLAGKESELARCFEMGAYQEASPGLELATMEEDADAVIAITEKMLSGLVLSGPDDIYGFRYSRLYEHMNFRKIHPDFIAQTKKDLLRYLQDEETLRFMKEDPRWQALIKSHTL